eukprot:5323935-Pleurochrysis_carterae.AAC.1
MSCPDQSRSERSAGGLRWQRNVGDGRLFQPRGRHSHGCLQDSISEGECATCNRCQQQSQCCVVRFAGGNYV